MAPPLIPKRRLWPAKLALLGGSLLICLLLLELLVRGFMPFYNPRNQVILQRNAEEVVVGIPNATLRQGTPKGDFMIDVRFNRHGFRDVKDHQQATTNDFFIAGDSYSMGWGVEENERYGNELERRLRVPFYNLAIPEDIRGYARTLRYVERHGARIRHLIIGLCMENDLWDYRSIPDTHAVYRTQMTTATFRQRVAAWFRSYSALWNCASHTMQKQPWLRNFFEWIGIARNIDQLTHKNVATPEVMEGSRDELVRFATNYNAVVLIIPSRALWVGNNIETENKAHEQFTRMLRDSGLKLVDMKPLLEQTGDPKSFYFKTDPHWNVKGHLLAAGALADFFAGNDPWKHLFPALPPSRIPPGE